MMSYVPNRKATFFISILAKIVLSSTGLLLVPVYAEYLTKQEYGYWLVILGIVNYLALANFGITQTIANYVAGNCSKRNSIAKISSFASTGWWLYLVITITLSGIITLGLIFKFEFDWPKDKVVFWVAGCGALITMPWQIFTVSLRSIERIFEEQLFLIISTVTRGGLILILLISGYKLMALALVNTFGLMLPRIMAKLYLKKIWSNFHVSSIFSDKRLIRNLVKPSLGFFTIQVAALLVFSTDNIVIGYFLGFERVPEYAVTGQLLMMALSLVAMISEIYYPTMSRCYSQSKILDLKGIFQLSGLVQLYLGSLILIGFWVVGEELILYWVGSEFYPGDLVFILMLGLMCLQIIIAPADAIIMATSNHKKFSYIALFEGFINVVLSMWWVGIWGVSGVVMATIVGRIISGVYMYATVSKLLNWPHVKQFVFIVYSFLLPLGSTLIFIELFQYFILRDPGYLVETLLALFWQILILSVIYHKKLISAFYELKSL